MYGKTLERKCSAIGDNSCVTQTKSLALQNQGTIKFKVCRRRQQQRLFGRLQIISATYKLWVRIIVGLKVGPAFGRWRFKQRKLYNVRTTKITKQPEALYYEGETIDECKSLWNKSKLSWDKTFSTLTSFLVQPPLNKSIPVIKNLKTHKNASKLNGNPQLQLNPYYYNAMQLSLMTSPFFLQHTMSKSTHASTAQLPH